MKHIPKSWQTSLWTALVRVIVIAFWVIVALVFARMMSWADVGSRGECPVEESIIPVEFRGNNNKPNQ